MVIASMVKYSVFVGCTDMFVETTSHEGEIHKNKIGYVATWLQIKRNDMVG